MKPKLTVVVRNQALIEAYKANPKKDPTSKNNSWIYIKWKKV
jgi:hypothetical protein